MGRRRIASTGEGWSQPRIGLGRDRSVGRRLALIRRAAGELTPDAIERIAQRVAELLGGQDRAVERGCLVDAGTLARQLGVTRAWIYEHAPELGGVRIGSGPRARLRFDPQQALTALRAQPECEGQLPGAPTRDQPRQRRRDSSTVPLLPIRDRSARGLALAFWRSRGGRRNG
jgi:hypothetical protein